MKRSNIKLILISIIGITLLSVGITFAMWMINKNQSKQNVVTTGCLSISIQNESEQIKLPQTYPITDEAGLALTPYTFTVKNNCENAVDYNVNLEAIGDSTTAIKTSSIKVSIDNSTPFVLSNKISVTPTINGAYESYKLVTESLTSGGEKSHSLKIWMDIDATSEEMSKQFNSKISVSVGHGITKTIKEGTLAADILANYNGAASISGISYNYNEGAYSAETDKSMSATTRYYWGTSYTYDEISGKYTLAGNLIQGTVAECRAGTKICGKYTLANSSSTASSRTLNLVTTFTSSTADTSSNVYITVLTKTASTTYAAGMSNGEAGLYLTEDNLGDSYYFRGLPTNNYVKFGSYPTDAKEVRGYMTDTSTSDYLVYNSLAECNAATTYNYNCAEVSLSTAGKDMYWRIVRINGDGTIRMIYDGTSATNNNTSHTAHIANYIYNQKTADKKYVGYVYEGSNGELESSEAKKFLELWYNKNLSGLNTYIADTPFCVDTVSEVSDSGYNFAANVRIATDGKPTLKCSNEADLLSVANGKLTYPIGLITADELMMAGQRTLNGTKNFYYTGSAYWTMTPQRYHYMKAYLFYVNYTNYLGRDYGYTTYKNTVRPVISLKADVSFSGEGTKDSPYEIVMD